MLWLLLFAPVIDEPLVVQGPMTISGAFITADPAFVTYGNTSLSLHHNTFLSAEFMQVQCQEDQELGLEECANMQVRVEASNNNFYGTSWYIGSDLLRTQGTRLRHNYFSQNTPYDSLFNFAPNHDLIDYQPRRTPYKQPKRLKTPDLHVKA